ncbi:COG4223 family protein [Sulfitobacter sp. 1A15299]|uniref:COG4223 family protein n=1 Tax=Sulfitobacter sp. 1A15299 TaxID=3368598 RepID=UPI0037497E27
MLLGGAIAAGLGFAASEYDVLGTRVQSAAELQSAMEAQQARIAELEARVAAPATLPESLPQVDALREELTASRDTLSALQSQLAEIDARLTMVEKQPATGGDNQVAVAAFEREMEALRASVAEQRSEIESLLENAKTAEEATAAAAEAARAQTAMTQMNAAISAGRPFEAPLAELQQAGVDDIPETLRESAAGGVVTLANLQARYPDAARQALATARAAVPEEGEGGFGSFLKRQLGARSVAPREGTDADAVLSRAEAAVRDGRLTDALAEIDTLPAPAQDAMAEWLADARARQAAETAANELSQRLTAN